MKDGFFRVAAVTPKVRVADPTYNREQICKRLEEGEAAGAGLMVFPELCLTAAERGRYCFCARIGEICFYRSHC